MTESKSSFFLSFLWILPHRKLNTHIKMFPCCLLEHMTATFFLFVLVSANFFYFLAMIMTISPHPVLQSFKNNPATPETPAISLGVARGIVGAERIPGTPAPRCIALRSQITFYFMPPSSSILPCPEWVSGENDRSSRHSRRQVGEGKNIDLIPNVGQ